MRVLKGEEKIFIAFTIGTCSICAFLFGPNPMASNRFDGKMHKERFHLIIIMIIIISLNVSDGTTVFHRHFDKHGDRVEGTEFILIDILMEMTNEKNVVSFFGLCREGCIDDFVRFYFFNFSHRFVEKDILMTSVRCSRPSGQRFTAKVDAQINSSDV